MNIIEAAKKYVRIRRGSWTDQQDFISRITIWDAFQFSRDNSTAGVSAEMLLADDWEEYREPEKCWTTEGTIAPSAMFDLSSKRSAWKKFTDEKPNDGARVLIRPIGKQVAPSLFAIWWDTMGGRLHICDRVDLYLDFAQYEWMEIPE